MSVYLHTQRYGHKDKFPLVLLHGFAGNGHYWSSHIEKLVQFFHLIIPDLPGHGKSEFHRFDLTFADVVDQLLDEILAVDSRPLGLAGYSMGSRLGMYFLTKKPERFLKAFFISGNPGIQDLTQRNERLKGDLWLADQIEEKGMDWFREYWIHLPIFATRKREDILNQLNTIWQEQNQNQLAAALRILSVGNQEDLTPLLQNNTVPILFAAGEYDTPYVEIGKKLSEQIPKFYFEIVPNCGHDLPNENPQWFQASIIRFFIKK